jgi:hypothetical protein
MQAIRSCDHGSEEDPVEPPEDVAATADVAAAEDDVARDRPAVPPPSAAPFDAAPFDVVPPVVAVSDDRLEELPPDEAEKEKVNCTPVVAPEEVEVSASVGWQPS